MSANNSNVSDKIHSDTTETETIGESSTPTKKRQKFTKTVPEISPVLEKLIEHSCGYAIKVQKELAKKNLDLPRLKRYLEAGKMVMNNLQTTISTLEKGIDNNEQMLLESPRFQHILNDMNQIDPLYSIGTPHQNSLESSNK